MNLVFCATIQENIGNKVIVMDHSILDYLRAGYPAIWIKDTEPSKVLSDLIHIARQGKSPDHQYESMGLWEWSCTKGWRRRVGTGPTVNQEMNNQQLRDPVNALQHIESHGKDRVIYVFKDFHHYIDDPMIIQAIRDLIPIAKSQERHLVFVSHDVEMPPELEKEIAIITNPLPHKKMLDRLLTNLINNVDILNEDMIEDREQLLRAAAGLTISEAENAFSLAYIRHKNFGQEAVKTIQEIKTNFINKTGAMEYIKPQFKLDEIGGLDVLKEWLDKRKDAYSEKARSFGLPEPRGILLAGVPGSGKSMVSKAVSAAWQLPLLRFDISRVFGSYVGESEKQMMQALQTAEAICPCILWIDEIEKAFSGLSGSGDSGVTSRVFGQFLTWMQEKQSSVFVIATANDVSSLPPEFMRKGRFDEFFWVDLPTSQERKAIFSIHLKKRKRNPHDFDLDRLVEVSEGYSGAEIEESVVSGLFEAFSAERELQTEDMIQALQDSKPLSVTMKERIENLRNWAKNRARNASTQDETINIEEVDHHWETNMRVLT